MFGVELEQRKGHCVKGFCRDFNEHMLYVGRFLVGSGAGAASLYVPRYLSEISPVAIRGGISTLNQVGCTGFSGRDTLQTSMEEGVEAA